jgi:hypothetical protein
MNYTLEEIFEQSYPDFKIEDKHIVCKNTRLSMSIEHAFVLMVIHQYPFEQILADLQKKLW